MQIYGIEKRIARWTGEDVTGMPLYDFDYGQAGLSPSKIQKVCREADVKPELRLPNKRFLLQVHFLSKVVTGLTYLQEEADHQYSLIFFGEDSQGHDLEVPFLLLRDDGKWKFRTAEEAQETHNRFSKYNPNVPLIDLIWEPLVAFLDVLNKPDVAKICVRERQINSESEHQRKATEEFEFLLKASKKFSLEEVKRICPHAWAEFSSDNPSICNVLEGTKAKRLKFHLLPTGYIGVKVG